MRHAEGVDEEVASFKCGAGGEEMEIEFNLQCQFNGFFGEPIAVDRDIQFSSETGQTLNVVGMLVGDKDSSEILDRAADGEETIANLAATQAGIDEQARLLSFEISAVAVGPAAQNRDLHSHVAAD